jgi:N-acetylglutamate synthase-like GNAT family acetyltransferase
MIQVRKVQPKDLEYIFQNVEALAYHRELMIDKLENMMIIVDNNEICGSGFYTVIDNKCILNWIHIHKDHRRNQLGTMLVKTILNSAEYQGALQAYMPGDCEDFAEFLGFQKITESDELKDINRFYHKLYQSDTLNSIFKVSLVGYFKPCNSSKTCD